MKVKALLSHALRSSPWPLDSVKSLYHIDGGGCDYAKGTGSSAQRLHAILADRSCRTQGPGDAPPVSFNKVVSALKSFNKVVSALKLIRSIVDSSFNNVVAALKCRHTFIGKN